MTRRASRTDANQNEIVAALRAAGRSVFITSALGGGFPDIVVGYGHLNLLLEIKDGSKPPSARQLTPDERAFFDGWKGQCQIVNSVEQALRVCGASIEEVK